MTDGQATAGGLSQPSIIQWAVTAWRDALAAFQQMPGVLGIAAAASFVVNLVGLPFVANTNESFGGEVASAIVSLLDGFVLTPAAIAVHRFVLLGERATKYRLEPSEPHFQRFFSFVVLIVLLQEIPLALAMLAQKNMPGQSGGTLTVVFVLLAIMLAGLVLAFRLLLLFPAIAVDAPGAAWSNALRDSRGHSWRMLFIFIATAIPLLAFFGLAYGLLVYVLVNLGAQVFGRMVFSVLLAFGFVMAAVLYAALLSRMFAAFGDRLKQPMDRSGPATA